jgi:putative ATP-binding cassette transporter
MRAPFSARPWLSIFAGAWPLVIAAMVLSLVSGLAWTAIPATIHQALGGGGPGLVWRFGGCVAGTLITATLAQVALSRLAAQTLLRSRLRLCRSIIGANLRKLEAAGFPRLFAGLTSDSLVVSDFVQSLPELARDATVSVGGLVYLGWTSPAVLGATLGCIVIAVIVLALMRKATMRLTWSLFEQQDRLFGHFRAVTEGVKELQLSRARRSWVLDELVSVTLRKIERLTQLVSFHGSAARALLDGVMFAVVGVCVFVLPRLQAGNSTADAAGTVLTLLFVITAMHSVVGIGPRLAKADAAMRRLQELEDMAAGASAAEASRDTPASALRQIRLRGVTHRYKEERSDRVFTVGPIDLDLRAGEITFIIGGNGSGKSTLAKLLTGLYIPEAGHIELDGAAIDGDNRGWYREHFSAIFADFYLLTHIFNRGDSELERRALAYLEELQLEHKVRIEGGELSTLELSQGQRKRLVLLAAYLEDRPVCVLDEWAADQDPEFKAVFYRHLLPELKARGKCVVVITHDDHYFDVADRIAKLNAGVIESISDRSLDAATEAKAAASTAQHGS